MRTNVLAGECWNKFKYVIWKVKEACKSSDSNIADHFAGVGKMVEPSVARNMQLVISDRKRYNHGSEKSENNICMPGVRI